MQSENLECKIAQAQMGRYLGGEGLSNEAILNLELHVKSCTPCKEAIQARRKALESVLALPTIEDFPALNVSHPEIKPAGMPWVDAIQRMPTVKKETGDPKKRSWRTPVMAGGLMAILFVMTNMAKEPTRMFGDRVITSNPNLVSTPPTTVANNALGTVKTEGDSPIKIEEAKPTFAMKDFMPQFLMIAVDRFNPANTDMALTRQIMEIELQKMAVKETKVTNTRSTRRRSQNVVRVYAPKAP